MSLFVGNISKNVRSRDLDDEFERFGRCNINYKVGAPERLGLVCFCYL